MTQFEEDHIENHKAVLQKLKEAQEQEADKLKQGYKYIRMDDKTLKLVKPKQ